MTMGNKHDSPFGKGIHRVQEPDLDKVLDYLHPRFRDAVTAASATYRAHNIRHLLIGGIAIGAYGYIRATGDLDFLVGDEAFEAHPGGVKAFVRGVPLLVGDIIVDSVPLDLTGTEQFLDDELNAANDATSVVVAPMRVIVYLKLRAGRRKDHNDIVQLVKMGCVDVPSLHEYIDLHVGDMDMLAEFDELAREGEER